ADELAAMVRLQELSTRLVATDDSSSLLQEICDAAIAMTGAEMGNIRLFDRDGTTLSDAASRGLDPEYLDVFGTLEITRLRPVGGHKRLVIEDSATTKHASTRYLDSAKRAGIRSSQLTPLVSRSGQMLGVLSTHYRAPHRFPERDLRV